MLDVHRVIGSLQQQRAGFSLDTTELCFLVMLRVRGESAALSDFTEDLLYDVFAMVCETTEPDAQNVRKRATHAIQRLREQRLLARVDGAGIVRAGDFTLTTLADAIVTYYLHEEQLTRESLAALTGALRSHLTEVLQRAHSALIPADWQQHVLAPLRHSVRDLVSGIERRQRGMDAQQEEVQQRISELLQRDWFQALDKCESLLEETTVTLQELGEILLRDLGHLQAQLTEIESLAMEASERESEEAAQALAEQVDRVLAWGASRQRVWSEYYQFVQSYLRNVVRLDPERALSQRLRDQIKQLWHAPYSLIVAETAPLRILREDTEVVDRPPVFRPRELRDRPPEPAVADRRWEEMEKSVEGALKAGVPTLHELLERLLPDVPPAERFLWTGRIAARAAQYVCSDEVRDRSFVPLSGEARRCGSDGLILTIQDWKLSGRRP